MKSSEAGASIMALFGIIGLVVAALADVPGLGVVAGVLLLSAAVLALSGGWFVGPPPSLRNDQEDTGIVGTQVRYGELTFTITDYNPPAGVVTPEHSGWPIAVTAVDDAGTVSAVFLAFDDTGRIVHTALPGRPWAPAMAPPTRPRQ